MKKSYIKAMFMTGVLSFAFSAVNLKASDKYNEKSYPKVEVGVIKATPETYKNKKISLPTLFWGYRTSFPKYIQNSRFDEERHYYLHVAPENLAVMGLKKGLLNQIIPLMKKGTPVQLFGRIKKFSDEPDHIKHPSYYLDIEHVVVLDPNSEVAKKLKENIRSEKKDNRTAPIDLRSKASRKSKKKKRKR